MNDEVRQALLDTLTKLEPGSNVDVPWAVAAASIAISLRQIADHLDQQSQGPPTMKRR